MSPDNVSLDDLSNFVNRSHGRLLAGSEVVAQLVHHCHPEAEERPLPVGARSAMVCLKLTSECTRSPSPS